MSAESARANRTYLESELLIIIQQIYKHAMPGNKAGNKRPRYIAIQRLCLQAIQVCRRLNRMRGVYTMLRYYFQADDRLIELGCKIR